MFNASLKAKRVIESNSFLCQRWRDRNHSYRPAGEPIRAVDYDVEPIAMADAKRFILQHHYSRSYPACRYRYGLFRFGELVGVAVFSMPMAPQVLTNVFPGQAMDSVELGRFVLLDEVPANGETWFKARCRELLKREGLRGIVAFSDDVPRARANGSILFAGHIGTIYQASNAIYLGRGRARVLRVLPDGSIFSDRAISKIRNGEKGSGYASEILMRYGAPAPTSDLRAWLAEYLPRLTRPLKHHGNLKYAWSLDRSTKLPASLPYPKKAQV